MTPSPNRQAVIVGLFVASAVVILAGGILTIGDLNDTFTKKISVSAVFEEVNGLQQGDNIWYSGVKVGIVKTVGFHGGSQVEIEMRVDREAAQYIHQDALAKIGSDGLIGSKIVVLYGGTPEAPSLQPGTVLQTAEMLSTETILAMVQENNTNLLAITTDLKGISGRIATGEGTIGKLLKEDELYTNINGTVASLNTASASAETLTASLSTFAGKLNKEGSLPNELVTDRTTYAALTGTVDKLQHAGTRASDLMDGLAKGAADPNSPVGTLMHDQPAGTDLKVTLDNMNKSSVLLTENLAALQDNILLRGYFKKKERAAAKAAGAASAEARDAEAEAKAQARAGDTEASGQ